MTTFFTSDTHFSHTNVIKYCKRPFQDSTEMDETMIANWNAKVSPTDLVYHLGDFVFSDENYAEKILKRLNGRKILVYGNHDKVIKRNQNVQAQFEKCVDYLEIVIQDKDAGPRGHQPITLCHFPMLVWNKSRHGAWMLHGHSHGSLTYPFEAKILDVGVDSHDYSPISYNEVKQIMKQKSFTSINHHD
jgi:calcineurin-like phosphoesterase family protein